MDEATAQDIRTFAEEARARVRRGDEAAAFADLERRYAEIREALDWCLAAGKPDEAFGIATALVPFWLGTRRIDEADAWYRSALDASPASGGTAASRARALHDHGYLVFFGGQYDLARRRFVESRQAAEKAGDPNLVALALAGSARVALNDDPAESVRLLREAYDVTRHLEVSDGRSSAEHVLGVALQMSGDYEGAREVMAERLERARAGGNAYVVAMESSNLSMVERQLGHLDRARELSLEALRLVSSGNDEMAIPWVINGLAAVTAAQGQVERAARLLAIADTLMDRAGGDWPADERAQHDATLAAVAAALSPAEIEALRAEARRLSLAEAVDLALG